MLLPQAKCTSIWRTVAICSGLNFFFGMEAPLLQVILSINLVQGPPVQSLGLSTFLCTGPRSRLTRKC